MNNKKYTYVANWKMNMPFDKALSFCTDNKDQLAELAQKPNNQILLCPEYPALHPMVQILTNTNVQIGAQNCSEFNDGAYTGQVSAQTLKQAGCTHCIVGHSERRARGEANITVAQKVIRLLEQNMQPIICFGETKQEYENQQTKEIIEQQLRPIVQQLNDAGFSMLDIYCAYEPVWSIGTGLVANFEYLENIFAWIASWSNKQLPKAKITYLYGGSVNDNNASQLKKIKEINGFLIGGASLDFQKLQKIVL